KRARSPEAAPRAAPLPETRQAGTPALFLSRWARPGDADEGDQPVPIAAPSTLDSRATKDFAAFTADELDDIERVARRIARRLKARASRRWKWARRGARLDLRRTVRWSLRTGGDPVELARRDRKLRRTKLVVLCDVSGSMDLYSRFLLQFLYALQHAFA